MKKTIDHERFVTLWQTATGMAAFIKAYGKPMNAGKAKRLSTYLRTRGVNLKRMPGVKKDYTRLAALAERSRA